MKNKFTKILLITSSDYAVEYFTLTLYLLKQE